MEKPARNLAIDTYRGFVMLLMMAEVRAAFPCRQGAAGKWLLELPRLPPDPRRVGRMFAARHHPARLLVSGRRRAALLHRRPHRQGRHLPHDVPARAVAALLLVALGVFLRSTHAPQTYYTFEDTLSQIGLGYPLLFLLAWRPPRWQWIALGVLLFGYWLAWALYPAQPADSSQASSRTGTRATTSATRSTSGSSICSRA